MRKKNQTDMFDSTPDYGEIRNLFGSEIIRLEQVDKGDKWSPHFLRMTINKLNIWFSFDRPIAFCSLRTSTGTVVIGDDDKRAFHAEKVRIELMKKRSRKSLPKGFYFTVRSLRSVSEFDKSLDAEVRREVVHTSSEIMRKTLGVEFPFDDRRNKYE